MLTKQGQNVLETHVLVPQAGLEKSILWRGVKQIAPFSGPGATSTGSKSGQLECMDCPTAPKQGPPGWMMHVWPSQGAWGVVWKWSF